MAVAGIGISVNSNLRCFDMDNSCSYMVFVIGLIFGYW